MSRTMIHLFNSEDKMRRAAAEWAARLNDPDADDALRATHRAWLDKDERHAAEFARMQSVLDNVEIVRSDALRHLAGLRARRNAPDWAFAGLRMRQWAFVSAGLVGMFFAGLGLESGVDTMVGASEGSVYATGPGEHRSILLSDGSTLLLNGESRVEVEMTPKLRRMNLARGEALFNVKKDPQRPFDVLAKGINVRAVGTSFNVNLLGEKVDVTVIEGTVVVTGFVPDAATLQVPEDVKLSDGQRLSYRMKDRPAVTQAQTEHVVAWQGRRLFFESATLEEVVIELGRSYPSQFKVIVTTPVTEKLSGVFEVGDLESTLKAIELVFPVRFERQSERLVHVLPRGNAG